MKNSNLISAHNAAILEEMQEIEKKMTEEIMGQNRDASLLELQEKFNKLINKLTFRSDELKEFENRISQYAMKVEKSDLSVKEASEMKKILEFLLNYGIGAISGISTYYMLGGSLTYVTILTAIIGSIFGTTIAIKKLSTGKSEKSKNLCRVNSK